MWSTMYSDILMLIYQYVPNKYRTIMLVCRSWSNALKQNHAQLYALIKHSFKDSPCLLPTWFFNDLTMYQKISLPQHICKGGYISLSRLKPQYTISWQYIRALVNTPQPLRWLFHSTESITPMMPNVFMFFKYLYLHYEQYRRHIYETYAFILGVSELELSKMVTYEDVYQIWRRLRSKCAHFVEDIYADQVQMRAIWIQPYA